MLDWFGFRGAFCAFFSFLGGGGGGEGAGTGEDMAVDDLDRSFTRAFEMLLGLQDKPQSHNAWGSPGVQQYT